MSWTDYRNAPAPGTVLARSDEAPASGAITGLLNGFPFLIVRAPCGLRAYVNACPHQYLPLDRQGDRVLSADGATLRCTNHSAGFSVDTGEGTEGLGMGCALEAIPVEEADGVISVAQD